LANLRRVISGIGDRLVHFPCALARAISSSVNGKRRLTVTALSSALTIFSFRRAALAGR
jgi:hypothetical protein